MLMGFVAVYWFVNGKSSDEVSSCSCGHVLAGERDCQMFNCGDVLIVGTTA